MKTKKNPSNSSILPQKSPILRIKERKTLKAGELLDHPENWRIHTLFQTESVRAILNEYGIVDTLKAYYSPKYKGYVLLNGHLRKSLNANAEWPVDILDITDEEASDLLMFLDRTTGWAQTDALKLDQLAVSLSTQSPEILAIAAKIQDEIMKQAEAAKKLDPAAADEPEDKPEHNGLTGYDGSYLKIVVHIADQLSVIEQAIRETGYRSRGEALVEICQFYLDNNQ